MNDTYEYIINCIHSGDFKEAKEWFKIVDSKKFWQYIDSEYPECEYIYEAKDLIN